MVNVKGQIYETPEDCLDELARMVRVATVGDNNAVALQRRTRDHIEGLKGIAYRARPPLDEVGKLKLITLEAEFCQQSGRFKDAVHVLKPTWESLRPSLEQWGKGRSFEKSDSRRLRRQKIWALMLYVFIAEYRLAGNEATSFSHFRRLKEIITSDLQADGYTPHGTLALCNYFLGLCFRIAGFAESEACLLEAQRHTFQRATDKLAQSASNPHKAAFEVEYRNLMAARILSGLGRLAGAQGNLLRAEHFLYAAKYLSTDVEQDSLRLFITSLLWTVRLKRTRYPEAEHGTAMAELIKCFELYRTIKDPLGQARCALEIARGHVDSAEFEESGLAHQLKEGGHWLSVIPEGASLKAEAFGAHMLRTRIALLHRDYDRAEKELLDANEICRRTPQYKPETLLMDARYLLATSDIGETRRRLEIALGLIHQPLQGGAKHFDPATEGECYLRIAQLELHVGNTVGAQNYLEKWRTFSQFVDNDYLHRLESVLRKQVNDRGPHFDREFSLVDTATRTVKKLIPECLTEYQHWLEEVLRNNHNVTTKKDLAKFYGIHPSNISRRSSPRTNRRRKT
jgi:hypothetical protein